MVRAAVLTLLLALGVAGATVAGLTSDARASSQEDFSVSVTGVQADGFSAVVGWRVPRAARVVVEVGVDDRYGIWSPTSSVETAASGQTTLSGLEPATAYAYRVVARSGTDTVAATGSFRTAPWPAATRAVGGSTAAGASSGGASAVFFKTPRKPNGAAAPTASAGGASTLVVENSAVFPRMVWRQCPYAYAESLAAGINLFMGTSCTDADTQLKRLAGKAMSALDYRRKRTSGPGLVGWHLPDEVDMSQGDPEDLPFSNDPGKVTFLTLTDHFSQSSSPPTNGRGIYPKLLARADMIGFDSYPVEGWCKPDSLERVFRLQKELAKLAAPKPTFQWIEAGPMEHCFDVDPTPVQVRAETWLAIAGGARGIGYFPDIWPNDIRAEVGQLNREIVALAPALLQPEGSASAGSRSAVKVGMRRYNGATYLIAVNSSSKRTKALITLPATGTKQLRVFADGRTVDVQGSQLYEDFPPYAARVYIAPPPGW